MAAVFKPEDYTVGWICALAHELAAARIVLDEEHAKLPLSATDSNSYHFGRIGPHNVVITVLPLGQLGNNMASAVATSLRVHFPALRFGLFTGTGGGVPSDENDIRLGDVVVGSPSGTFGGVVQYDIGKKGPKRAFERIGNLKSPPEALLTGLASFKSDLLMTIDENELGYAKLLEAKFKPLKKKRFFRDETFKDNLYLTDDGERVKEREARDNTVPLVFFGTIASGNQVIKTIEERDRQSIEPGGVLCFEMEAAGVMNTFPCLIFRGISDYCDARKNSMWQNYAAASAASVAADFLRSIPVVDVQGSKRLEELIKGQTVIIKDMANSQAASAQSMRALDRAYLSYLKPVSGVAFDEHNPVRKPLCMENTRVSLFREIDEWQASGSQSVYWLSGRSGSGKSTIARSVTLTFKRKNILGASYFFPNADPEACAATSLFRTIAVQLTIAAPELMLFIASSANPNTANRSPAAQLEELIVTPVRKYDDSGRHKPLDLLVVIDALDRCGENEDAKNIAELLSQQLTLPSSRLRFFVTSEMNGRASVNFQGVKSEIIRHCVLDDLPKSSRDADISQYLGHALSRESADEGAWPSHSEISSLMLLSDGNFTYARTLCQFINGKGGNPKQRMGRVLASSKESSQALEELYRIILTEALANEGSEKERQSALQQRRLFLYFLAVANELVSIMTCAGLLGISLDVLETTLEPQEALFDFPADKTRAIHFQPMTLQSLLLDPERCPKSIYIQPEYANIIVADRCFALVQGDLEILVPSKNTTAQSSRLQWDCMSQANGYALRQYFVHLRNVGPAHYHAVGLRDGGRVHSLFQDTMKLYKLTHARGAANMGKVLENIFSLYAAIQNQEDCVELKKMMLLVIGRK